ncbi:MAG: hypothetical protein IRY85_21980 [Micromonosporaceae bacterium]|nr:hypothetical protein [Micromonosporaceae bacterium]
MAVIPDDGGGGFTFPTFKVEINSLADFLSFIEHDLGTSLDTGLNRIKAEAESGAGLAAGLVGPMIAYSRLNYLRAQDYPIENLVRYLFTGAAMLEVIEYLMKMYKTTEEMAVLTTEEVRGFLSAAYQQKYEELKAHEAQRIANQVA